MDLVLVLVLRSTVGHSERDWTVVILERPLIWKVPNQVSQAVMDEAR